MNHFDYDGLDYFGLKLFRGRPLRILPHMALLQLFRRSLEHGVVQGLSFGQVGKRHLFYVGSAMGSPRVCVAGIWLTTACA